MSCCLVGVLLSRGRLIAEGMSHCLGDASLFRGGCHCFGDVSLFKGCLIV